MCSCSPSAPPSSTCTTSPISPACSGTAACVGAGTGSATVSYTYSAASCAWIGSTSYASCTCPAVAPSPVPTDMTCPAGLNTAAWNWNSSASVCAWQKSCSCVAPVPATKTDTVAVACNVPAPAGPGMAGYSGNAYKKLAFDATAGQCKWKQVGWDTSGCTCNTSAPPFSEPTTSTCNLACQNETVKALNWYKYTDVAGVCTKTFDHTTPSSCSNKVFTWQIDASSPPIKDQNSGPSIDVGQTCNLSCLSSNEAGNTTSCKKSGTNGKWDIYSCKCLN